MANITIHQRQVYRISELTTDLVGREFIVRNYCKPTKVTLLEVHPAATNYGSFPQWCKWRGYQDGELFVNSTSNPEFELELLPLTDTPVDDDLSLAEAAAGVGVVHPTPLPTREEILALAVPEWTIVDQLYCPLPPDSAAWVTEPNGPTLYLRTSNGSRLWLRAPSHLSHAKILETLRNILERRQTVTQIRLDDLLVVMPLATHCGGCNREFDPPGTGYNHEVVLGVHPHQMFTNCCADCYNQSYAREEPLVANKKVYLLPEEPPPRKQLWDSWANPQWEEP